MKTDAPAPVPRPVSLLAVAAVFILLSVYWPLAERIYVRHRAPAPQNQAPANLPKEQAWRATPAARRAYLSELREKQARQAGSYIWLDRQAGLVRLPIERAMELIVEENGGKK
jgi:hypothetical protein